ncbi:MAG: hypothetical protein ACKO9H_10260 [Planctomycetota bacterium]
MSPNGDLAEELRPFSEYVIETRSEAKSICKTLQSLYDKPIERDSFESPLHSLQKLFLQVGGPQSPAFQVFEREGLPLLIRHYERGRQDQKAGVFWDQLFILKILAMYGSFDGATKIVEAARESFQPSESIWHSILGEFAESHPHRDYVYQSLSAPLPGGFIAIALLDSANDASQSEGLERHPFDSEAGERRLQDWLTDTNPDSLSFGESATAALPFISDPGRDRLLALAMDHVSPEIQLRAAWVAAKFGRESGAKMLSRFCGDLMRAKAAVNFLTEVGREDLIPDEARQPAFLARAEMAAWLAHPNELGMPPDEIEVLDHRELAWPPTGERKPFWLIWFRLRDRTGLEGDKVSCGVVGSMTWSFFFGQMEQRPPEDVYAIHSCWEMQQAKMVEVSDIVEPCPFESLLLQWWGHPLEDPRVTDVAKISSSLDSGPRTVAVASARIGTQVGWVALDGADSVWYPKDEQPEETAGLFILQLHIGRKLLGFKETPNRKRYLQDKTSIPPAQLVQNYERLVAEIELAVPARRSELLGSTSPLRTHFRRYCNAIATLEGSSQAAAVVKAYSRFLKLASQVAESGRFEVYDSTSLIGWHFDEFVESLIAIDEKTLASEVITKFRSRFTDDSGRCQLSRGALRAGNYLLAKEIAEQHLNDPEGGYESEQVCTLAEALNGLGEAVPSQKLLEDSLRRLKEEFNSGPSKQRARALRDDHADLKSLYLRLFPNHLSQLKDLLLSDA